MLMSNFICMPMDLVCNSRFTWQRKTELTASVLVRHVLFDDVRRRGSEQCSSGEFASPFDPAKCVADLGVKLNGVSNLRQ